MQLRSLFHGLILLPLWLLFFWGWYLILFSWPRAELIASLRLLAFVGSVCGIIITLWIRHNIGIFRRKGPRLQARHVSMSFLKDVLGRPIVLLKPDVLHDSWVVLDLENGTKVYGSGAAQEPDRDKVLTASGPG